METTDGENNNIREPMKTLPYAGEKGCTLIKSKKIFKVHFQIAFKHA